MKIFRCLRFVIQPSATATASLLDLELPPAFGAKYPGPQFSVAGTRRLSGVHDRLIIGTVFKPSVRLSPEPTTDRVDALTSATAFVGITIVYRRMAGVLIALSGFFLLLPLPVRFSNALPALNVRPLLAASLAGDGLCFKRPLLGGRKSEDAPAGRQKSFRLRAARRAS